MCGWVRVCIGVRQRHSSHMSGRPVLAAGVELVCAVRGGTVWQQLGFSLRRLFGQLQRGVRVPCGLYQQHRCAVRYGHLQRWWYPQLHAVPCLHSVLQCWQQQLLFGLS